MTVDEITAGVTDAPSATTTHVWTAAPTAPIGVTARQTGGSGRAGTSVELTAHVSMGTDALADVPVTFADDRGAQLGGDSTDRAGDSRISYTDRRVGTERITASAALDDCRIPAATLDIDRWVPTIDLTPANATSIAGTPASMVARLMHGADPVSGETIAFTSHSTSCDLDDLTPSAITDPRGEAGVALTRTAPSVDTVTAVDSTTAVAAVPRATTHTWGSPADRRSSSVWIAPRRTSGGDGCDRTSRGADAGKPATRAEVTLFGLSVDPIRLPPTTDGRTSLPTGEDVPQTETIVATAALGCESSIPARSGTSGGLRCFEAHPAPERRRDEGRPHIPSRC